MNPPDITALLHARDGQRDTCPWCRRELADEADDRACCDAADAGGYSTGGEGAWLCWSGMGAARCEAQDADDQRERAEAAEARVKGLEELLREIRDAYHDNRAGGWRGAGDMLEDAICRIDTAMAKSEGGR